MFQSNSDLKIEVAVLRREIELLHRSHATEIESWKKIVSVLERIVPLPPAPRTSITTAATASEPGQGPEDQSFHFSESGEEYESRISHEHDLALSLGVAPWSPAFQEAIDQMRRDIMKPRIEYEGEGDQLKEVLKQYTEAEADDLVREAFRLAQASASVRSE